MSSFWTGFFTSTAAFGGIWLKDYLDRKKTNIQTTREKAIEAYTLVNKLLHTHNIRYIMCSNLIKDSSYNWIEIIKNFPDTIFSDLERLEILIIENFYTLSDSYNNLSLDILKEYSFLSGILTGKNNNFTNEELEKRKNEYLNQNLELRKKITDQLLIYINIKPTPVNMYVYYYSLKKTFKDFFKKDYQF